MPKKIDPEFEGVVKTLSELGHLPPAIIKILKKQNKVVISETGVRNIINNVGKTRQLTSQGLPPPTFKRKPKTLTTDVLKKVKDMMTQKNPPSHRDIARKAKIPFGSMRFAIHKLVSAVVVNSDNNSNLDLGSPDPCQGKDSPGCPSPKNIEVENCTICCQNIENAQESDISTSTSVISQTICKLFGIQDHFESFALASTYCLNCSSLILKIQKIWQDLDEAKLQLEEIIIKNAAGAAGNIILDQNPTEIARNEIIKRIRPCVNPEAGVKLENGNGLNEVLNNDLPDWNLFDDNDQDNYLENADETQEEHSLGLDHNEAGEFYFSLKTPVLKLTKLPQSLVDQLTQKNVHPKIIQNGINLHLKKDQENQIINKSTKSSVVNSKKEFPCIKCGKSYNHKKELKEHYELKHGNDSALRSRKQLPIGKDNSTSSKKEQSHLCHLCSKVLTTPFHLHNHLKSHSRKNILCPMADCLEAFESNDDLQDHLNIHNDTKVHKCPEDQCDNVYYTKKQLAAHLTNHMKFKGKFECTLCSSSFGFAKNLLSHKKTVHNYTESTEFMCEICARVFSSRSRYSRHKFRAHKDSRKHNDEKKQCPICKCWFRNDLKFERHKNIHMQLLALTDQIFSTDSEMKA